MINNNNILEPHLCSGGEEEQQQQQRSRKRKRNQMTSKAASTTFLFSAITTAVVTSSSMLTLPTVRASTGGYLIHPGSRNYIAYNSSSIQPSLDYPDYLLPEEEPTPQNLNSGQRCGVTDGGERDYNVPKSRADTSLPLNIQEVYVSGSEIELVVNTMGLEGGGHFEFHLCALEYPQEPTEECFQRYPLEFVQDHYYGAAKDELYPERAYLPFQQAFEQYGNELVRVESQEESGMGTNGFGSMMEFKYTFKLPDNQELWTDVTTTDATTTYSVEVLLNDIESDADGEVMATQWSDQVTEDEEGGHVYDGKVQISGTTGGESVLISAMVTDGNGTTTMVSIHSPPIIHENGPLVDPVAICTFGDVDPYGDDTTNIPDEIKKICGSAVAAQSESEADDSDPAEEDGGSIIAAESDVTAPPDTSSYPKTKYALLRWHYQTARDCFPPGYDTYSWPVEWGPWQPQWGGECDGDESQDEYWNCAEVLILSPPSEEAAATAVVEEEDVNVPNEPPMAINDIYIIGTNEEVQLDVLTNDVDPDEGDSLHVGSLTSPKHGVVGISQDGSAVIYIPDKDYVGLDSFEYRACDKRNLCDAAIVDISVGPTMQFVFAMDDKANTTGSEPVYIDVLKNDIVRVDNWPLFVVGAPRDGRHGTCTVTPDNWILYKANAGYEGQDRCSYKACITSEICDTGVIYINVLPPSIVPQAADTAPTNKPTSIVYSVTAVNDGATTGRDRPIKIAVLANDEFTGNVKPRVTDSAGANSGVCQVLEDEVLYTPNLGFVGWDRCNYTVCIGNGVCDVGLVKIKVFGDVLPEAEAMAANLNPVVANPDDAVVVEGSSVTIDVLENDEHLDGDVLEISAASSPLHGSVEAVNNLLRYTSRTGYVGTDSFKYSACDKNNQCGSAAVVVTIMAEVLAVDDEVTTMSAPILVDVVLNDKSSSGSASLIVTNVEDGNHGSCSITASNKVRYIPTVGFSGWDRCDYIVCAGSACDQGRVNIHVLPEETPPPSPAEIMQEASVQVDDLEKVYAQDDHVVTFVNEPIEADVTGNDFVKGMDKLKIMHTGGSYHGTCEITYDNHVRYTPNTDFEGSDQCGYIVCHSSNMCDEGILRIDVINGSLKFHQKDRSSGLPPTTSRLRSGIAPTSAENANSYPDDGTIFLPASADAFITTEFPTRNFGDEKMLYVSSATSSAGLRDTMLKFHTSSIDESVCEYGIESATLSIYSMAYAADGGTLVTTSNKMWAEMEVTWDGAPMGDGIVITDLGPVEVNTWCDIDVSSAVTPGDPLSIRIISHKGGNSIALYASRDHDDKSLHPVLKIKCLL